MHNKTIFTIIFSALAFSCSNVVQVTGDSTMPNGIRICVSAPGFICANDTRSSISTDGTFAWNAGDKIGIFSSHIGTSMQSPSQLAMTLSTVDGTSVAYSSTTGWHLIPEETFKYVSYYPYSATNSRDEIYIEYTGQVQAKDNSTEGLGAYDYMYSTPTAASTSSSALFSFNHIGCLTNVCITVPSGYENTTFYNMRLFAESAIFTTSATYSIDDIVSSGTPSLDAKSCYNVRLSFGDKGIKPTDGVIRAWIIMAPTQWKGQTITAKLYAHKYDVPTLAGSFTPDVNQSAGTRYSISVTTTPTGQILPDKPKGGEQLNILLFGHSFGLDCTEYLPAITKAAGITNVHYGRWYQANCSLAQHWGHFIAKDTYLYYDSHPDNGTWSSANRTVDDVLAQYPWDIILFQQSIGFNYEGKYSSYQPHLNYLSEYVTDFCETVHGKTPIIGWNMFWGFNEGNYTDYDRGERGAMKMYEAIVQATKDMTADTTKAMEIPLITPPGTALQNARGTSLNDPGSAENPSTTKLLTRDGNHVSYGIGRYVTACTWFQYLITPIYGIGIEGNTYRPTATSFEKDLVTDERAAICWKCAIEAVKHPFEVTPIVE